MEIFYEFSCKFNALETQEILYRKYSSVQEILNMPITDFVEFVKQVYDKDNEEILHRQWCALLPLMSMKMIEYISFKDYYDKVLGKNIDTRPTEVILKEIEETKKRLSNLKGV